MMKQAMTSSTPRRDRMLQQLDSLRAQTADLGTLTAIMAGELKGQQAWDALTQMRERRPHYTDDDIRKLGGIRRPPAVMR